MGLKTRLLASGKTEDNEFNISLLGFKMAVNEGLTVFNLVDGVVDEFHDESGTDEGEGSNDTYCATSDYYHNITFTPAPYSAGFTTTATTEEDTSEAGTNPKQGCGTFGTFTVPTGLTALTVNVWGSGGGGACSPQPNSGGGGGFASGVAAVTPGQALTVVVGEGGEGSNPVSNTGTRGGLGGYRPSPARAWPTQTANTGGGGSMNPQTSGTLGYITGGGGLSGLFSAALSGGAPTAIIVAGSGGGGEYCNSGSNNNGGGGGGLTGFKAGSYPHAADTGVNGGRGGGGDQEQGGAGGTGSQNGGGPTSPSDINAHAGGLFYGGNNALRTDPNGTYGAGGGAGYYGGGGGAWRPGIHGSGGGGSSFYGHPQVTSGATEASAPDSTEGGGTTSPLYVADTNEGGAYPAGDGEDGYVLLSGTGCTQSPGATSTIVSNAFAASSVPTTSRIVVFQENVETPTLNTDIIASISRDGGSNFTTATLTDSGYVTGSSGQRILTGQAAISGQPSGQSMRWKLALANNTVRIHGVSLQWS